MATFKALNIGLQDDVVSSYDQTKTTIFGNAAQRVFQSVPAISPPPVKWIDVFTDAAETPAMFFKTKNGRIFAITAVSAGLARVMCYSFNNTTGVSTYVGKIQIPFPNTAATTHTLRGFKVDDSNSSAIKIFVATTGSVVVNGGTFMANNVPLSDFTPILSVTLAFGVGSNIKAMYFLQDPAAIGSGNLNTSSVATSFDNTTSTIYTHNGVSATHQFYLWDYSIAPNNPSSNVTITIASPGVVTLTAHGFNTNDQVVFTTTGALPTGINAGTVYFARNVTANTFEVSATSGGASINTTGTQSGTHSVSRAFGITSALWKFKTGNGPALTGTLLANNSEKRVIPVQTINGGSICIFFATSTALYLVKVSDLTSGATSWPSLITVNLLGATNELVAPTAVNADYDDLYDVVVFTTFTTKIIVKNFVNSVILAITGILNNDYLEGMSQTDLITETGAITIGDFKTQDGWTMLLGTATGQRGLIGTNVGADILGDTVGIPTPTYMTTKVLDMGSLSTLIGFAVSSQDPDETSQATVYYRTSGFGSATGGWILLPKNLLFPSNTMATQIQFKIGWSLTGQLITNPTFIIEGYLAYLPQNLLSDNWEGSVDNSTQNGASPAKSAFRLAIAYSSSVPTLYFRAYDDSGNLVVSADTVTDASLFEYSTNNGISWLPLGTIPNTINTTEVRYNWTMPPGVRVSVSLRES